MNIAVIAANGRSGQAFVEAALAAGHSVRGGIRGKSYLPQHPQLTTSECDATNPDQLSALIEGQDAVVSLIGHVKGSPSRVQTEAMEKLVAVMSEKGIKRLVSLTGTGARFPGDKITLTDRVLNLAITLIDPDRVNDGIGHVEVLKKSALDWTIIRVLKLTSGAPSAFSLKENGPTKQWVAREDVAKAILQVLEQKSYIRQAPILSKP